MAKAIINLPEVVWPWAQSIRIEVTIVRAGERRNPYCALARRHLKECDAHLEKLRLVVGRLEGRLASTPKPSQLLGWK